MSLLLGCVRLDDHETIDEAVDILDPEALDLQAEAGPVDAAHTVGQGVEDLDRQVVFGREVARRLAVEPGARRDV